MRSRTVTQASDNHNVSVAASRRDMLGTAPDATPTTEVAAS
jgi:hypothetical protein